jgi:hypothetical protein
VSRLTTRCFGWLDDLRLLGMLNIAMSLYGDVMLMALLLMCDVMCDDFEEMN